MQQTWKKMQTSCIFAAPDFVMDPQILIFLVFSITSFSPYWLQIIFSMSMFFYFLRSICSIGNSPQQTSLQCLSMINMVFSDEYKFLIKTQIHSAYAVTRVEELKSVHLKCNLFAFSSISGIIVEYLQKI